MSGASKPLEAYDPEENDAGLDVEALIEEGRAQGQPGAPARARYFTNEGSFYWAPCHVVGFEPETRHFDIAWAHSGRPKRVKRLNLCFDAEAPASLSARIRAARREKAEVEARARQQAYLDSIPFEHRDIMDADFEHRVMYVAGWDLATRLPSIVRTCMAEMRDVYVFAIKQAVVRHQMTLPDPPAELAELHALLGASPKPPVPSSACCQVCRVASRPPRPPRTLSFLSREQSPRKRTTRSTLSRLTKPKETSFARLSLSLPLALALLPLPVTALSRCLSHEKENDKS